MTTNCGVIIKAIPIYLDTEEDEEFTPMPFVPMTFYEISTTYPTNEYGYGLGTIVVSSGLEYFTKASQEQIHSVIREAVQMDKSEQFYLN